MECVGAGRNVRKCNVRVKALMECVAACQSVLEQDRKCFERDGMCGSKVCKKWERKGFVQSRTVCVLKGNGICGSKMV